MSLKQHLAYWKLFNKTIVFTNGCFDILHPGHLASLQLAAGYGDVLLVGLNSDASVRRLKGDHRPINQQQARAMMLAGFSFVDGVIIFEEDTPRDLIVDIMPNYLVKGGDYRPEQIAGAAEVLQHGGEVVLNPIIEGFSTTSIIEKTKKQTGHDENRS